ncbi:hypothetical protein ATJ88_3218 [Isoptericola jiangsuensis]|uniref:Uncharacterized protein n=1 Tax=Isoptericola jiangsuensis TaxID=548579 RepID=A0A2A9F0H2_9MICO|nr:hypothetical protein [Isoptericola jiangsuensis]PFG44493.1 hypothetical protein ATJ88_3218 [Isoptericola jiangsuensis]
MTTVLTDRDVFVAAARRRGFRRVVRSVTEGGVIVGAGFWAVFTLVAVVVPLIVDAAGNEMGNGVLVGAEYSARWFAFTLGIILVSTIMTNHVAAGGTRRSLFTGSVVAALLTGAVYGVLNVVAFLVERAVFTGLGWTWTAPVDVVPGDLLWWTGVALSELLVVSVYVMVGVAVAVGYQNHGAWTGTLLLLPGLVLLAAVELAAGTGSADDLLSPLRVGPGVLWAGVGVAVLAVAAGWMHLHLSRLRLRPTR